MGIRLQTAQLTQDPALNMRLGATFLSGLIDRYGGALPLAILDEQVDAWVKGQM